VKENGEKVQGLRPGSVRGNIVVIDDKPANLRLITAMLEEQGHRVRPVLDGQQGLDAVRAELPDLILLDVKMPEMDGYQVCEHLKADKRTRDIPVIFISAMDALLDKVEAFRMGGVDYITKPFQITEVLARVETHLALFHTSRQLQRANEKMAKELVLAGKVQRSLLPIELPAIAGWELAVKFEPAGETSGDFFDVRLLPNGNVCMLVADVIDKGVSAALFMALTWHALRVYADRFPANPERAVGALNNYVLRNIPTGQFVTIFFGILDPASGKLCYCNAGHHSPFHVRRKNPDAADELRSTGIPVGFIENTVWEQAAAELDPGDLLAIYTDGVTEARSPQGTFFSERGLLGSMRKQSGNSPRDVVGAVFTDLQTFMAGGARTDDITLLVIKRDGFENAPPQAEGNTRKTESVLR